MMANQVIKGDCLKLLSDFNDNHFDLTIFSPPYDGLRDYNGYSLDLHSLGEQLFRVTKNGGIVAMVIQDQTLNGHKTLTTFKTIVDWCENIGFGLFETIIYQKIGKDGAWWSKRFRVDHEYIPIFVKGRRPNYFDKTPIKIPTIHGGKTMKQGANRNKDGKTVQSKMITVQSVKCPGTIWNYRNGGDKNPLKRKHPAVFPDKIPYDLIQVFSKENDLILDPMCGSGSTLVGAKKLNRRYIGMDISQEYVDLAEERIKKTFK
jgi:DNA modification methylase